MFTAAECGLAQAQFNASAIEASAWKPPLGTGAGGEAGERGRGVPAALVPGAVADPLTQPRSTYSQRGAQDETNAHCALTNAVNRIQQMRET